MDYIDDLPVEETEELCGFLFYPSYYEALKGLKKSDRLPILDALVQYAFTGEIQELTPVRKAIFSALKPSLDHSLHISRINKRNGKKGGRPRRKQTIEEEGEGAEKPVQGVGLASYYVHHGFQFPAGYVFPDGSKPAEREKRNETE